MFFFTHKNSENIGGGGNFWRYLIDFSGSSGVEDRRSVRQCH